MRGKVFQHSAHTHTHTHGCPQFHRYHITSFFKKTIFSDSFLKTISKQYTDQKRDQYSSLQNTALHTNTFHSLYHTALLASCCQQPLLSCTCEFSVTQSCPTLLLPFSPCKHQPDRFMLVTNFFWSTHGDVIMQFPSKDGKSLYCQQKLVFFYCFGLFK